MTRSFMVLMLALVLGSGAAAQAAEPIEVIQSSVDAVLKILKDPQYQDEARKSEQLAEIRKVTQQVFDFTEISKRALAANWKTFTPDQRREFTGLFADILENTYLKKIQTGFKDERVNYLRQEQVAETKTIVRTRILRPGVEIPVDYSMQWRNGSWRVYDVVVEGVSLIKNYRSQYNQILLSATPDQLIARLRAKTSSGA